MSIIKPTQKEIVFRIVKEGGLLRTEEIKIKAMREGISCSDRFLRYLAQEGMITSIKLPNDRTKTWMEAKYNLEEK